MGGGQDSASEDSASEDSASEGGASEGGASEGGASEGSASGDSGLPRRVDIREVGPRDGLQLEAPLTFADKARLIGALAGTGVRRIEATAFVSPRAVPSMADAERVGQLVRQWPHIEWSALAASPNGARRAVAAGFTSVEYVVSAGNGHSLANVGRPTEQALAAVAEVSEIVHGAGGRLEVIIATAWDCPFDGPTPPARTAAIAASAVELGADALCLGDTIGTTVPGRVTRLLGLVRSSVPGVDLGVHFHNTRGTGIASAWAAVQAGVTRLDSSVGGLGGCPFAPGATGNIATDELVYLLTDSGIETGVDLAAALEAARLVEDIVGHPADSSLLRAGGRSVPRLAPGAQA
jgi:hydroxymethylglutaryl-CoA lyase